MAMTADKMFQFMGKCKSQRSLQFLLVTDSWTLQVMEWKEDIVDISFTFFNDKCTYINMNLYKTKKDFVQQPRKHYMII